MKPDDGRPAKTTRCDKKRSESILKKRREQYIGSVINGWKITDVYKKEGERDYFCTGLCPLCNRPAEMRLSQVKKINKCMKCTNNIAKPAETIKKISNVDGSSLTSIKARLEGKINRNSTTGVTGVCKDGNKYKATITFKGRRIHLGMYEDINDAIKARKEAEKMIYQKYIDQHPNWEQEMKDALEAMKGDKSNEQSSNT